MTLGSLYSGGIDAFAYAAEAVGIEVKWHVEKDYAAFKYLEKNYPNAKRYRSDDKVGKHNLERVDIICGGEPCQPHSVAGDGLGKDDDRFRWPQMLRITDELRPTWFINENVTGTIGNLVLDQKIIDLEKIGYTCQPYIIPAVAIGAHHKRERVFLVAYSNASRREELVCPNLRTVFNKVGTPITLGACGNAFLQFEQSMGEPALFPVADGIPDKIFRLGAAGNSIVSPIPIILLTCIKEINKQL